MKNSENGEVTKVKIICSSGICIFAILCIVTCIIISSVKENIFYEKISKKYEVYDSANLGLESNSEPKTSKFFDSVMKLMGISGKDRTNNAIYKIKQYDGKIAIYDCKNDEISSILDVYTFTLPPLDREAVENGILIYSDYELNGLIEDFTG